MSYHTEIGQSRYEGFYFEFLMLDGETGCALPSDGIDHQLRVYTDVCDYGDWQEVGQLVASNSNGLIYPTTKRGLNAIKIPASGFGAFLGSGDDYGMWRRAGPTVRAALIAVPPLGDDAKLISTLAITFGETSTMARVTYKGTPYYPAPQVPSPSATQVKIQLAAQFGNFDDVEAGLPASALDPARLTWATGGPVTIGGPLANAIQAIKTWNTAAMQIFLTAAAAQPT